MRRERRRAASALRSRGQMLSAISGRPHREGGRADSALRTLQARPLGGLVAVDEAAAEHQSFQAVGGIMVSGAERVRGGRYPLVMPSQIAVVIKPVVASSSSGSRSPDPSCTVKPLETGADPTRRE